MSTAATPTAAEAPALLEQDIEPRTPMRRLGSTRKLAAFSTIRLQLGEQTRVLEARAEAAAAVAAELHDYCRRRADLEHEYARALDKMARAALQRHKEHKHKRAPWSVGGALSVWQAALEHARGLSRDHAALGALYAGPLAARLQRAADDVLRLHRKCRELVAERQEELGGALAEAGAAGKAAAAAAADWRAQAHKLRRADDLRRQLPADHHGRKKAKALDKDLEKRRARHSVSRARALRARADYALCLEAANATLQRYYLDDIADVVLCTEVGFEAAVGGAVRAAGAAEGARAAAAGRAGAALAGAAAALDAAADRQRLLDAHAAAFALPPPLAPLGDPPHKQDADVRALLGEAAAARDAEAAAAADELRARLRQLAAAARTVRAECREAAKTLDAAEDELLRQMEASEPSWDVSRLFGPGAADPPAARADDAEPRRDQEDYYLAKFRAYVSSAGRLARLEARAAAARARLAADCGAEGAAGGADEEGPPPSPPSPPRRAAARARRSRFAAPLDTSLPRVLTSCVRVIASYGLQHQGLFRVSGSQLEVQALRAAFERGEDPLARARDASDVNSVCGLLKLFLRSLRPPPLAPALRPALLRLAAAPADAAFVRRLRRTLGSLPAPALLLLRYLFAFLAHVAEHAARNMMDAWNLAICLGPTLLEPRGDAAAQLQQQNLGNELLKRIILHHRDLFPQDIAPHTLYPRTFPRPEDDEEAEEEAEPGGGEAGGEGSDRPDAVHDMYDDDDDDDEDDDDEDDEISEDGESGEWQDSHSGENRSCGERAAVDQVEGEPRDDGAAHQPTSRRLADSTPDLVLDLPGPAPAGAQPAPSGAQPDPAGAQPAPDGAQPGPATPAADSADTFLHNRDTLKKKPRRPSAAEDSGGESEGSEAAGGGSAGSAGSAGGSPVPARNTARVAAKFADLTLTGGSLKPALAAKPALLRRPTPHPRAPPAAPRAPPAGAPPAPAAPPPAAHDV